MCVENFFKLFISSGNRSVKYLLPCMIDIEILIINEAVDGDKFKSLRLQRLKYYRKRLHYMLAVVVTQYNRAAFCLLYSVGKLNRADSFQSNESTSHCIVDSPHAFGNLQKPVAVISEGAHGKA